MLLAIDRLHEPELTLKPCSVVVHKAIVPRDLPRVHVTWQLAREK
jgi:hypothetical protein